MHNRLTPTFSVITITYNAAATLEDTIQSIIAQTYHHIEYIVVDGASTDNTLQVIEKYRSNINKLVSEPDKGLYDAMNKGINLATGDYLIFLNAGDCFHDDTTLQKIVAGLKGKGLPDIIYGNTAIVDHKRHFVRMRRLTPPDKLHWRSFRQGMLVCHQAFIVKRSLAEQYDCQYRFSSDFDWCIRMMKKAHLLHNSHLTLIDYLDEGLTTQNHKASLCERYRIMAHHYGHVSTFAHHLWFAVRSVVKK